MKILPDGSRSCVECRQYPNLFLVVLPLLVPFFKIDNDCTMDILYLDHAMDVATTVIHAMDVATAVIHAIWQYLNGDRFNSCQVVYSQFGLAIHQNDHQARRRFVEWAQNEIAVVPDFHKRILFSDEAHFWLNGYVNKQNCRIWSEANPQVYVETPLHPEKLTVWCALWAGGILLQKR
ncbi:hypothetical protein TNCV_3996781 [Trichonephila clavipes]|nr:hypothetical protein TNCV_3996781 [Trichonephila clavipes]